MNSLSRTCTVSALIALAALACEPLPTSPYPPFLMGVWVGDFSGTDSAYTVTGTIQLDLYQGLEEDIAPVGGEGSITGTITATSAGTSVPVSFPIRAMGTSAIEGRTPRQIRLVLVPVDSDAPSTECPEDTHSDLAGDKAGTDGFVLTGDLVMIGEACAPYMSFDGEVRFTKRNSG